MRWKGRRGSQNVQDRRGMRIPGGASGLGLGGILLLGVIALMTGDARMLTGLFETEVGAGGPIPPEQEELAQMISVVLADTEEVWTELFRDQGEHYEAPPLVLFTAAVESACGRASSAVGPFYCPNDGTVYLDLAFFDAMERELGAPGDFAQAYVVAHEVGHHVQNLLGVSDEVHAAQQRSSEEESNQLSVRLELQADFLAGVFAHHAQAKWQILEVGDVEEALKAASRIGDDWIQKQAQGYTVPDTFTHGTSEQRARWFRLGLETGDIEKGDTFQARDL